MSTLGKIFAGLFSGLVLLSVLNDARAQTAQYSDPLRTSVTAYTRDMTAATGTVAYTGVGFRPRVCILYGGVADTSIVAFGAINATVSANAQSSSYPASPTAYGLSYTSSSFALRIFTTNALTDDQRGTFSSMDADGFTLSWTKVGSPTGSFSFVATCFL